MNQVTDIQSHSVKIPPHSIDAEQSVLGGLMINNEAWYEIEALLCNEDFYRTAHRLIFSAIEDLARKRQPFDVLTITDALKQKNQLPDVGGEATLFGIVKDTPSAANIMAYATIVRERSVLRKLAKVGNEIAESSFNPGGRSALELIDGAEQKVFAISEQRLNQEGPVDVNILMSHTLEKIDTLYKNKGALTGISSGLKDLDDMTAGLQPADLIIIAARPSMGKTTLAMNIAENVALNLVNQKKQGAVLVFSLEMPSESLIMRMMSSIGKIHQQNVRTGRLHNEDWPKLTKATELFHDSKLLIDDTASISPAEIRARSRRVAREHGSLALIVIDYLQLIKIPGHNDNRVAEVSEISRSLKAIAKEFNCPVIAGSQLNRSLEQRQDKRPIMSDIRESGSIEQDADIILFIYRDEVYHKDTAEKNHAEIIIAKHRNGATGAFDLTFNGSFMRFDDYISPMKYQ